MLKRFLFVVCISCSLTGCITPYQPSGLGGGYTNMALNKDMFYVTFKGNGYTPVDVVQSYVLRRAAELAINNGYKYFVVVNSSTSVNNQIIQTPSTVQTQTFGSFGGNAFGNQLTGYNQTSSYTTITPGNAFNINRYETGATIKMLHSNKGYPQAYDANIILSNYRN